MLFLRIPPLVRHDAVPVAVGAGEQRGVSGGGAGVGIVVVTVGEIRAMVEEEAESAFAELIVVAFEIVAAKLVDDNHHDQLGMGVVGGGEAGWDRSQDADSDERNQKTPAHCHGAGEESHRESSVHSRPASAKARASRQCPKSALIVFLRLDNPRMSRPS